jgi:hypothetical protein
MVTLAKPKLGSGQRFKELSEKIQKEGQSKAAAQAIAAKVGMDKYGKSRMQSMAKAGRKRAKK